MSEKIEETDQVPGRQCYTESWRSDVFMCMPCSKKERRTEASVYCRTCNEFQCSDCSKIHDVYAFLNTHKLVETYEAKANHITLDMKGMDKCEQHQEYLKLFCEDDNQLCCSTCAVTDHRKCHSVVEIQKIAETSATTSSKLKVILQEVKSKAEMMVENTNSSKEQLSQDINEISLKIRRMRDDVIKMFDDLEVSVTNDAESFKTKTLENLTKTQSDSEKHIAEATKYLETINNVYQSGTPSQKFIADHKMEKHVNELCSMVDGDCHMLETVTIAFDFDETLKLPPLPVSDYVPGKLTLKYYIPEAVKSIALEESTVKFTKIASVDLKRTGENINEPLYSGLDFLPDGRLVSVDNKNKKCLIYNEKLEKVGSHALSFAPQSVVAVSEEEVAITSANVYNIDFLHVSKSNEITLIKTFKVQTQYDSICLKDEGHFLVGTIDDTRPVRVASLSGEEKDFSISFPSKKYPINYSACTYIKGNGKIVVTDRNEHIIYIYDTETNTRVVVKDDQIKEPRGLAVDPSGYILVCSNRTDTIVQISPTGRILKSCKLDMEMPYRVCVSKDKSVLAVTNSLIGEMKLQLFQITS